MNTSLRTKDNLVVGSLFQKSFDDIDENTYKLQLLNSNKIITKQLFSNKECNAILINAQKYGFDKKDSYDKNIRQSKQLCIIDEKLSYTIYSRLIPLLLAEYSDIKPYGLLIAGSEWELADASPRPAR